MNARMARYLRAARRWGRLLTPGRRGPGVRVSYGHDRVPGPGDPAAGGTAKLQKLAARFPNAPADFGLLYLGSSALPRDLRALLWAARRRRAPVVVNQNGVGYPAWAGERTDEVNEPLRRALHAADHVLYQSAFCRRAADRYLGEPRGSAEILPNAVDVGAFTPGPSPDRGPVLLLGGDQLFPHRLELALATFALVRRDWPDAELIVAGRVANPPPAVPDGVTFVGRYAQRDAPDLYRRAHLLLHTQVNDSCPSVVLEAMACGLPVVHPASGGTVELVGDVAGLGVPHPESWDRYRPPEAEAMAAAAARVLRDRAAYATAARARAVELFPLDAWLDRHAALFQELTARRPAR